MLEGKIMTNIAESNALTLEGLIEVATRNVQEKNQAFEIAQARLIQARDELFQLRTTRDAFHIQNLNDKQDWDMVFNYTHNETDVATEYRQSLLNQSQLIQTGHYNSITQQHCFAIKFETDTADEHQRLKTQVVFILNHLKVNPETGTKSITLENILDDSWSEWTLVFTPDEQKYSVIKQEYGVDDEIFNSKSLEEILRNIQSISDLESTNLNEV